MRCARSSVCGCYAPLGLSSFVAAPQCDEQYALFPACSESTGITEQSSSECVRIDVWIADGVGRDVDRYRLANGVVVSVDCCLCRSR